MTKDNTYVCCICHGTFEKGWTDEEASAELTETFPGVTQAECDMVCDDCFKGIGFEDMAEADKKAAADLGMSFREYVEKFK